MHKGNTMVRGFGAFVRREREARGIGLREMARNIGLSPTYISKVERGEDNPPAEGKVKAIAGAIGCDADELLARAGRVASDLLGIIKRNPVEVAALLRAANGLSDGELARMVRDAGAIADLRLDAKKPAAGHRGDGRRRAARAGT